MATILAADDDPDVLEGWRRTLTAAGHLVIAVPSARQALATLASTEVDVVLADVLMSEMSGIELCAHVAGNRPDIPVVLVTDNAKIDLAIEAIRAGAHDYLLEPVAVSALLLAVERAQHHRALQRRIRLLRSEPPPAGDDRILGRSASMRRVFDVIDRLADTETSVLVVGASDTGKELVARALHDKSRRHGGKFVTVNCAALPESLLESELFGHAKGAFTDAKQAYGGLFAQAHRGTLLLDEIGDMPLGLQPKLLRVLQERRVRPVGSTAEIAVDVRIIAATNQRLEQAVEEKRFRSDLFFRLNVVQIGLPPLSARGLDVLILAEHFLAQYAGRASKDVRRIGEAAAASLLAYAWPGNVRELQNAIERGVALGRHDELCLEDLPEAVRALAGSSGVPAEVAELGTLREVVRRHIARVLSVTDNNKTIAARVLGIDRKTLYRKLEAEGAASASTDADVDLTD